MRKYLFFILILLSACTKAQTGILGVLVNGGGGSTVTIPSNWSGKHVHYYGNSITKGEVGPTSTANRWTTLLATAKGATEHNYGINGQVLQYGINGCEGRVSFDMNTIVTKGPNDLLLFIALGVNDIGLNNGTFTPSGYQVKLDSVVSNAISKGWAAGEIVILTPFYYTNYASYVGKCGTATAATVTRHEAYVNAAKAVAQARHTILADTYTATKNNGAYAIPDGIHPNNTGHQIIATYLQNLSYTPQ